MDKQFETVDSEVVDNSGFVDGRSVGDNDTVIGEKQGTLRDVENMKRLGKEQLFKVRGVIPSRPSKHADVK